MARPPANEFYKTQQSLESVDASAEWLREIRPPLQQIQLFAPRFGYGLADALNIQDCFSASRDNMARYDFSGSQGAYSGTSIPGMGVW